MVRRLFFFAATCCLCAGQVRALPYADMGLSRHQAAAILLSRFAYGPRPGDVDRVAAMGPERWFEAQLQSAAPDTALDTRLAALPALKLSERQMVETYRADGELRHMAQKQGVISEASMSADEIREAVRHFADSEGLHMQGELMGQLGAQKLLRAVYSKNQLREVMTDFWFNHFNVSVRNSEARPWVLGFERDAIRPRALGHFRDLLGATARHPAMLYYLNNAQSTAPEGMGMMDARMRAWQKGKRERGINENYARELMELHTLGVDGGYTQADVVAVARAFTGWTVWPVGKRTENLERQINKHPQLFVREGNFLFSAPLHDAGEKHILGMAFQAGGGIDEGERVLDMLASNPATAHHLSLEIARRFVADAPPDSLVDRLASVFLRTKGDIAAVLRAIVDSPAFWQEAQKPSKVKSPFELVASALRGVDAEVTNPQPALRWVARLGQPLYACVPPTGYPDVATAWMNAGTMMGRVNFALALASGHLRGVRAHLDDADGASPLVAMETQLLSGRNADALQTAAAQLGQHPGRVQAAALIMGSPTFQYR